MKELPRSAGVRLVYLGMLFALAGSLATLAWPQPLMIETQTLSATREAAGVYLQVADPTKGLALPPVRLNGATRVGPLLHTADYRHLISTTGTFWTPETGLRQSGLTVVGVSTQMPLAPGRMAWLTSPPEWWQWAAGLTSDDHGVAHLVLPAARIDQFGVYRGRLDVRKLDATSQEAVASTATTYPLPSAPAASVVAPDGRAAVLCYGEDAVGAVLRVLDLWETGTPVRSFDLSGGQVERLGAGPAGLALSPDSRFVYAVTHGHVLGSEKAGPATWVFRYQLGAEEVEGPVRVVGAPYEAFDGLLPVQGGCWVVTHDPGTDHAFLSHIEFDEEQPSAKTFPIVGVRAPLQAAVAPGAHLLALGAENRLEIWGRDGSPKVRKTYPGLVGAIAWPDAGLFIGEAGRLHAIDPSTAEATASLQLQTGHVSKILILPEGIFATPDQDGDGLTDEAELQAGTRVADPDTDADGIVDSVDTDPLHPSAVLTPPPVVTFTAGSGHHQRRALPVIRLDDPPAAWDVTIEPDSASTWLQLEKLPRHCLVTPGPNWTNPESKYRRCNLVFALNDSSQPGGFGKEQAVTEVRVLPSAKEVRRILWLSSSESADTEEESLAELLAGPPHYFAQQRLLSLFVGSLDPFDVVVLDAHAVSRGALTRPALLDYVAEGGAVLFIGSSFADDASRTLTSWFAPLGLRLNTAIAVNGRFPANREQPLLRNWDNFSVREGCGMSCTHPEEFAAMVPGGPGENDVVFAARHYGLGKIAFLTSPSPLSGNAMKQEDNRRFAAGLFRWLSAPTEAADSDGDGLTDILEDRNGNGVVDAGETNLLSSDTDGDGVADGLEDRNRNGRFDEGETNPLSRDSDADGIWDGADEQPLPPVSAPQVAYVEPAAAPAEGGLFVVVMGRNLPPESKVYFGAKRAGVTSQMGPSSLLVEAPPYDGPEGGTVDVRIETPTGETATLPEGFRYGPVSTVRLRLAQDGAADTNMNGGVRVLVESDPAVALGRVSFVLAGETGTVNWSNAEEGDFARRTGRQIVDRTTSGGHLWIDLSPGQCRGGSGTLMTARWKSRSAADAPLGIRLTGAQARARNGVLLKIVVEDGQIRLTQPPTP